MVQPIPEGFRSLTPHLTVETAAEAIEFYKRAFNAKELGRHAMPEGKSIMHALLRVGDSMLMLNDEFPEWGKRGPRSIGATSVTLHLFVEDVDAAFDQAVAAGAKVVMPLGDAFWGDRYGTVEDPYGHQWSLATHKKELTPEQIEAAAKEMC